MLTFRSVAVRRSIFVVYVALIVLLSLLPENDLPKVKLFPHADKLIHMGMYAGLTCLLFYNWPFYFSGHREWIPLLVVVFLGMSMEVLQRVGHYGRSFDLFDEVANITGFLPGWLFWRLIEPLIKVPPK